MPDDAVWRQLLEFYRSQLRERYQIENLARFPGFEAIPSQQIDRLREFFLCRIYPPVAQRREIDAAFERLTAILHAPRKLQPLMRGGFASAWRLGARLPQAIAAGRACFDAYRETRRLEDHLLREARQRGLQPGHTQDPATMYALLAQFPEHEVRRLIADVVALFHALENPGLLETALEFMRLCEQTSMKRADLYGPEDTAAFRMGVAVLEDGIALFNRLDPQRLPALVRGIEQVELDWYARVKQAAQRQGDLPE